LIQFYTRGREPYTGLCLGRFTIYRRKEDISPDNCKKKKIIPNVPTVVSCGTVIAY
jgi:hypothetical protein